MQKMKIGMPSLCCAYHFFGKIDTNPSCGSQGGQEIAHATADLKHALLRRDEEFIHISQPPMVVASPELSRRLFACNIIPVTDASMTILHHGRIFHFCVRWFLKQRRFNFCLEHATSERRSTNIDALSTPLTFLYIRVLNLKGVSDQCLLGYV